MIRCAICDDDGVYVEQMRGISEGLLAGERMVYEFRCYTDPVELYYDIGDGIVFDIVILDIEMPRLNGIEIAKMLKEKQPECLVIFLTVHKEYAIDAFELEVFRFIPKDEVGLRFEKYFMDAVKLVQALDERSYVVEKKGSIEKIPYKSIRYLKKHGKYTLMCCTDGRETKVRKPINIVIEELDSPDFIFVDRGCAVNICYISRLHNCDIYLKSGERLSVSRSNIKMLQDTIAQYWGERF